jgi:hypothetical protein
LVGFNPSEKYDFGIWEDDIPKISKNKMGETTNQIIISVSFVWGCLPP